LPFSRNFFFNLILSQFNILFNTEGYSAITPVAFFSKKEVSSFCITEKKAYNFHLNTVQNQLLNLERGGVLYSKLKGKVRLFGINPRYPFKKELEALLEKALKFIPEEEKEKFYMKILMPRRSGKPL